MTLSGIRPLWLTFDCYGTLIQWDEGLLKTVTEITRRHDNGTVEPREFLAVYDEHEHALKRTQPHQSFRTVTGSALQQTMKHFELPCEEADVLLLINHISSMPPFPETVRALVELKELGFQLSIISNTDDDIITGNVAQLGGTIDCVITAEQAQAYKPSRTIFEFAHHKLGVTSDEVVHVCASPQLDLVAARDIGFRCIWINRGTERAPLPDYSPNAELPTLEPVPDLFRKATWT